VEGVRSVLCAMHIPNRIELGGSAFPKATMIGELNRPGVKEKTGSVQIPISLHLPVATNVLHPSSFKEFQVHLNLSRQGSPPARDDGTTKGI
jgi:hypothetical protein